MGFVTGSMGVAMRGQLPLVLALVLALIGTTCIKSITCEQATDTSNGIFKESVISSDEDGGQPPLLALGRTEGAGLGPDAGSPLRANSRLLTVPFTLARYMFPSPRPGVDRQAQAALMASFIGGGGPGSNKRSANGLQDEGIEKKQRGLDSLTGITGLGKRSVPVEYINYEPIFRAQTLVRGPARVHNMRWAPIDAIGAPLMADNY